LPLAVLSRTTVNNPAGPVPDADWGGVECPSCHEEVYRLLLGKCVRCQRKVEQRSAADIEMKAQLDGLRKELSRSRRKRR
jgi:hypothetical protein